MLELRLTTHDVKHNKARFSFLYTIICNFMRPLSNFLSITLLFCCVYEVPKLLKPALHEMHPF